VRVSGSSGRRSDRRERNGDKRERILDAAETVFADRGFYQARVSEIAREARVADGTIYLYFKSKDDILISLFESRMERVNRAMSAAVAAEVSAPDKLRAFIRHFMDLVRESPALAEVLTVELRQSSKFMKEYSNPRFAEFLKLLATVIKEGQNAGELDTTVPPHVAARAIFGVCDELTVAWLLSRGEKFDIVRAADWIGAMTLSGLERRTP
jgi:TetR/AcrR family fatty acid metabolism transcriptional regulator